MSALGIEAAVPLVGFVFPAALEHGLTARFARALKAASALLKTSDAEWERVRPLMKVHSEAEFTALKTR